MSGSTEAAAGSTAGPDRGRYLVGAEDPMVLHDVAGGLADNADVTLLKTVGNPPSALVVEATPEAAERLRAGSAGRLIVEPDSELTG